MQVSVIIISYNVKYYLEQCLHSVLAACRNMQAEIIIVDNASTDNSLEYLKPKFPLVDFIKNETNTGFARANNKALNRATGKYILFLNPDTILSEDILTNCVSFFEQNSEAGGLGVKMIDGNGNFLPESKRAFPSVIASFFKLSGMAALFPHSAVFNKYALGNLNENEVHETDVLAGAFFISRRNLLLSLNGFDEDFFMYGEDIDLSYRIQKAGYKNYYLGNNVIIHFKGESTLKGGKSYVKNFYGAMKIFVARHYKTASSFFLRAAIHIGSAVSFSFHTLNSFFRPAKKQAPIDNFRLIGDEDTIQSAVAILSANKYAFQTFVIQNDISFQQVSLIINRELAGRKNTKPNLVFCVGKLTYLKCIRFIQNNKNKFVYYWHYKDSGSIISASETTAISQIYVPI